MERTEYYTLVQTCIELETYYLMQGDTKNAEYVKKVFWDLARFDGEEAMKEWEERE